MYVIVSSCISGNLVFVLSAWGSQAFAFFFWFGAKTEAAVRGELLRFSQNAGFLSVKQEQNMLHVGAQVHVEEGAVALLTVAARETHCALIVS